MEPRSLRLGWSGIVETDWAWQFFSVETEDDGDTSVLSARGVLQT